MPAEPQHRKLVLRQSAIPVLDIFMISLTYVSRIIEESLFSQDTFTGGGIVFYSFIPFLVYTVIKNPNALSVAFFNPLVITFSVFIFTALVIESLHPTPSYRDVGRTFYMVFSIPLFAVWVYKDTRYLYYISIMFIIYSLVHSLNLAFSVSLPEMLAVGNSENARALLLNSFFTSNSNGVSYLAGTSLLICYIIIEYTKPGPLAKFIFNALIIIFFYTLLLCLSRSGTINFIFLTILLFARSKLKPKAFHLAIVVVFLIGYLAVSNEKVTGLLFSRFETVTLDEEEATDSRAVLYIKVLKHLDEVFLFGVGEGNYYGKWGINSDFNKLLVDDDGSTIDKIVPTHNSFAQIIYYWGIIPLALYIIALVIVARMIRNDKDSLYIQIANILFYSTFILIIFSNNFNTKDFSMIFGVILGLHLNRKYQFK